MRSFRHWTPRYVRDRLAVMAYQRMHPDAPWLTAQAISILSTWLKPTDVGFEWGSGRSTVWFARRVRKLCSVEHDASWARRVPEMLAAAGVPDKVDYRVHGDFDEGPASKYVGVVDEIPDASLDFVLVDGLARDWCALACVAKLRSGGLAIVDNANWYLPTPIRSYSPGNRTMQDGPASPQWAEWLSLVQSWRGIWTSNGVTDTALWVKL